MAEMHLLFSGRWACGWGQDRGSDRAATSRPVPPPPHSVSVCLFPPKVPHAGLIAVHDLTPSLPTPAERTSQHQPPSRGCQPRACGVAANSLRTGTRHSQHSTAPAPPSLPILAPTIGTRKLPDTTPAEVTRVVCPPRPGHRQSAIDHRHRPSDKSYMQVWWVVFWNPAMGPWFAHLATPPA